MALETRKIAYENLKKENSTFYTGNSASGLSRNLNIQTDALYGFHLLDIKDGQLRLVNAEQVGQLTELEQFRNKNNGLVLEFNSGNMKFTILPRGKERGYFHFQGTERTSTGIVTGFFNSKYREHEFLFFQNVIHNSCYYMYFPIPQGENNLRLKYLAGDLDDRLEHLYRRLESHFAGPAILEDKLNNYKMFDHID